MNNMNLDVHQITQAGNFLFRQLQQKLPELLREREPEMWGANGTIIPTTMDLEPGAREVIEETLKEKGREAAFYSEESNDITLVDVAFRETPYKVLDMVKAYSYTIMELLADQKANRPIRTLKAQVARRVLMEKRHKFALFGSARHQMSYSN